MVVLKENYPIPRKTKRWSKQVNRWTHKLTAGLLNARKITAGKVNASKVTAGDETAENLTTEKLTAEI